MASEKFVQQIHDLQRKHLEEVEKVQCHATELGNPSFHQVQTYSKLTTKILQKS